MMKIRQMGKDGWRIGEVGLGCWQFGGDFGDMAEETALAIMAAAVDLPSPSMALVMRKQCLFSCFMW